MKAFLDELSRQKLVDLLLDDSVPFLIEATQVWLHQSGTDLDIQGVLSDIPRYARRV